MKFLILILFLFFSKDAFSQNSKKIIYEKTKHSAYIVKPIDQKRQFLGAPGMLIWAEEHYIEDLTERTIAAAIPEKVRNSLSLSTGYIFEFNKKGEVFNWRLLLSYKDTLKITEDQIYLLFQKFNETKIDMNKVRIEPSNGWKSADYISIVGSLKSSKSRKNF